MSPSLPKHLRAPGNPFFKLTFLCYNLLTHRRLPHERTDTLKHYDSFHWFRWKRRIERAMELWAAVTKTHIFTRLGTKHSWYNWQTSSINHHLDVNVQAWWGWPERRLCISANINILSKKYTFFHLSSLPATKPWDSGVHIHVSRAQRGHP